MLDVTSVSSLEYYRQQDSDSKRETLQYYTDNETVDRGHNSAGIWEVFTKDNAEGFSDKIVQGEAVAWDVIEPLSRAENPDTNEAYGIKRNSDKVTNARDLTFSAPKDLSVLHGMAKAASAEGGENAELWKKVAEITHEAHVAGVRASLDMLFDEDAFAVRSGKGGKDRTSATHVVAARFDHFTSRDGDMQLHSHCVFPNVARAEDGSVKAWDNHKVVSLRGKASAIYRAEMVAQTKARLAEIGVDIHFSKDGRNFKIDGLEDNIKEHFSKRRTAILNAMYEEGYTDTANNRKAAQFVSYSTRRDKSSLPPISELYNRWKFELSTLGHSAGSMLSNIIHTSREIEAQKAEEFQKIVDAKIAAGQEPPTLRDDEDVMSIARASVAEITNLDSVFERNKFETTMIEHMQTVANAHTALSVIATIKSEEAYIKIGEKGRSGDEVFTDRETLMSEYHLLALEDRLRAQPASRIDPAYVQAAIDAGVRTADGSSFKLNPEQENLVRHLLSDTCRADGIGDAGTGKTTSMIVVKSALDRAGFDLVVCAPTNKAVTVLSKELDLPADNAFSVAKLVIEFEKGNVQLNEKTVVLLDEAGMVSRGDWVKLLEIADKTGCRFVGVGDPKQLPPVQAGAPFRMVTEAYGAARLQEIARQNETWARQASKDVAAAKVEAAVMAYSDRGFIKIEDSVEAVHEKALNKYFELEESGPGTTLMIAATNAEVRKLNKLITEQKIEKGILTGEQFYIEHSARGTDAIQTSLIMKGSIYALAENVVFDGERYSNNLIGKVQDIKRDKNNPDGEPWVTMRWEDGRTTTFKPSSFVGFREENDKLANVPKLAPADVLTEYQSQGLTMRNVVRPFTQGTSTQSLYVSMTRHKQSFHGFIDGSRIETNILNAESKKFTLNDDGSANAKDDVATREVTQQDILSRFINECKITNSKANACDYLGGAEKFLRDYRKHYEANFSLTNDLHKKEDMSDNRGNDMSTDKENKISQYWPRGIGRLGGDRQNNNANKAKNELQTIAETRANSIQEPEIAKSPKVAALKAKVKENYQKKEYVSQRISPEEMMQFSRVNLRDYVLKNGGNIRRSYKFEGTASSGGREYQMEHPAVGKIVVTHFQEGSWGFMSVTDNVNGNISNFVAAQNGIKKMQAYHSLRREFGTSPSQSMSEFKYAPAKQEQSFRQKMESVLQQPVTAAKQWVVEQWKNAAQGYSAYLLNRGISKETLLAFKEDMRLEGKVSHDRRNDGGVMFAMRDGSGNLTGYTRKGTQPDPDNKNMPISRAAGGSVKNLVRMGDQQNPKRIYVGETIIDTMSLWQRDKQPERSLLVASSGRMNEREQAGIYQLAQQHPQAVWQYCVQNDQPDPKIGIKPNDIHLADVQKAILEANKDAQIDIRTPPEGVKDWNDVVKAEMHQQREQRKEREQQERGAERESRSDERKSEKGHGREESREKERVQSREAEKAMNEAAKQKQKEQDDDLSMQMKR